MIIVYTYNRVGQRNDTVCKLYRVFFPLVYVNFSPDIAG